ncbi:MAG: hypothetical protein OIF54_15915, partial [Cohaesibacter sp.]|nr:hypothetical protein [Cohaesibacter sp.]
SMQKVRIKKENAPALSDRADALPVNHFKASYGSIFYAVGIIQGFDRKSWWWADFWARAGLFLRLAFALCPDVEVRGQACETQIV